MNGLNNKFIQCLLLISLLCSVFITAYNGTGMIGIALTMGRDLRFSLIQTEWLVVVFLMVATVSVALFGQLRDIIGSYPCVFLGNLLFLAGSIMLALTNVAWLAILGRCFQGLGAGALIPTTLTGLKEVMPKHLALATGLWSGMTALAFSMGPIIGGAFVNVTWRWLFWLNVIWRRPLTKCTWLLWL